MGTDSGRSNALRTIFSFFLALMMTAFVGVGVYTFHPPPMELNRKLQESYRQDQAIRGSRPESDLTTADREQLDQLRRERVQLLDAGRGVREAWGRSTSIILIVIATLAMAISLVRADQLLVLSNGLLLGGVFTMLYGVGWIIVTDTSPARFIVMTVALGATLALGYARFVRRGAPAGAGTPASAGLADLEGRLKELEERVNGAASALGRK